MRLLASAAVIIGLAACGKPEPQIPDPSSSSDTPGGAAMSQAAPEPVAQSASDPALVPAEDQALAAKRKAVEFALSEQRIAQESNAQWAKSATASSSFNDNLGNREFSPRQATGAPNVGVQGDNPRAWAPKDQDGGIEWLQASFEPVIATELRVRQSAGPGAIIQIELIDEEGLRHTIFEGIDDRRYDEWHWWFVRTFPPTPYLVTGARITLATNAVPGWNEIDAVQLIQDRDLSRARAVAKKPRKTTAP